MRRHRPLLVLPVALALLGACGSDDEFADTRPTLPSLQRDVLDKTCLDSGCHNAGDKAGGLVLTSGLTYGNTVSQASSGRLREGMADLKIVDPGVPDNSSLYLRLAGDSLGPQMPKGRKPLPANVLTAIRDWIADGAPNN